MPGKRLATEALDGNRMNTGLHPMRVFLHFGALSGLGWILDFGVFAILAEIFAVPGFISNFLSSYVGVTFVYFASLKMVFKRSGADHKLFLVAYWGFQFLSILFYSQILEMVATALLAVPFHQLGAKIIITPFNLISNFLFMKLLVRFMHPEDRTDA